MKRTLILIIAATVATVARAQLFDTSAAQVELVASLLGTGRVFSANIAVTRERHNKQARISDNVLHLRGADLRIEHKLAADPALAKLTARLKKRDLAEVITILLPRQNKAYLILPAKKSYLESPVVADGDAKQKPRTESKLLRLENLDGHPCAVRRLTFVAADDSKQEIVIWEATDLQGFILKSEMDHGDDTMEVLRFTNIKFDPPGDDKFTAPAQYRKLSPDNMNSIADVMSEFNLDRDAAVADMLR
jgi:hypothetical protein